MTDWASRRVEAARLRLQVELLALELAAFFGGTPTGGRVAKRMTLVVEALTWVVNRADRELRKRELAGDAGG